MNRGGEVASTPRQPHSLILDSLVERFCGNLVETVEEVTVCIERRSDGGVAEAFLDHLDVLTCRDE